MFCPEEKSLGSILAVIFIPEEAANTQPALFPPSVLLFEVKAFQVAPPSALE